MEEFYILNHSLRLFIDTSLDRLFNIKENSMHDLLPVDSQMVPTNAARNVSRAWMAAGILGVSSAGYHGITLQSKHAYLSQAFDLVHQSIDHGLAGTVAASPGCHPIPLAWFGERITRRRFKFPTVKLTESGGSAYATIPIIGANGKKGDLFVTAERAHASRVDGSTDDPSNLLLRYDDYDRYVIEGSGFSYFADHPWELKILAIKKWREIKKGELVTGVKWQVEGLWNFGRDLVFPGSSASSPSSSSVETSNWTITSLAIRSDSCTQPILGDIGNHPHAVPSRSRTPDLFRWGIVASVLAGLIRFGLRRPEKIHMSREFQEAVGKVLKSPILVAKLGSDVKLKEFSGLFEKGVLNGSLTLYNGSRTGILKMHAFKEGAGWRFCVAELRATGRSVALV